MSLRLAVIGKDVSKSDSPAIHAFLMRRFHADCSYEKVSIPPEEFSARAASLFASYDGFNVTIPFKGEIIPYLERLEGDALTFGAVNTVVTRGRLGYNTDGYGFLLMLQNEGVAMKGKSFLVLGAGGAGRSCIKKLTEQGADVFVFERDPIRTEAVFSEIGGFTPLSEIPARDFDVILNCTGIGMHKTEGMTPEVVFGGERRPLDASLLERCGTAVDLIYTPRESEFLRIARMLGKKTVNGEAMLFYQAYMADCIYLSRPSDAVEAGRLWKEYREEIR